MTVSFLLQIKYKARGLHADAAYSSADGCFSFFSL